MRTDIIIRRCCIADAQSVQKLSDEAMGYEFSLEDTTSKLNKLLSDNTNLILIAELNGEAVGYIHAVDYDLLYAPHYKNIMGIAVSPNHRRLCIGTALLAAVEQWAVETGAEAVRLCSGEERIEAHEFYRKLGYVNNKKQLNFSKPLK